MVERGNTDKHRYGYSGGVKAVEQEKWGRNKAQERYGALRAPDMKPADASQPQDRMDKPSDKSFNGVTDRWLLGKDGTLQANFDKQKK